MDSSEILIAMAKEQSRKGQARRYGSGSLANLGLRCGAFLIDYVLTLLVLAIPLVLAVYIKRRWSAPTAANFIIAFGYLAAAGLVFFNWVYVYTQNGQSFGKTFIGLRVVRIDGAAIDYKTAFLRHILGYPLSIFFFGLGMLWILWDRKQQGWHDKIAKTVVIKAG
jgi:uncharacterized RDD family membrane protein YckC